MRKVIHLFALLGLICLPFSAQAKLGKISKSSFGKKGTVTIGATLAGGAQMAVGGSFIGFNNINVDDDDDDNDQSTFSIAPNIGYFIMDNLELDLGLAYHSRSVEDARRSLHSPQQCVTTFLLPVSRKRTCFPMSVQALRTRAEQRKMPAPWETT